MTCETREQVIKDSTLVILKSNTPLHDTHTYPLRIPLRDVESISTIRYESLVYVESGVEAGKNYGADSPSFSPVFLTLELGYVSGERARRPVSRWGYGATVYFAGSSHDFRGGFKGRVRYRFNRTYSLDAAAGPLLGANHGSVASVGVNLGRFVTLKSEYMSAHIEPWSESDGYTVTQHPEGTESVWYNGVTFRNGVGWVGLGIELTTGIIMLAALFAGLSALD